MRGPYKELALRFRPDEIRYLLIGESPPFTPPGKPLKYFYNYKNTAGGQMLLSTVCFAFLGQKFYVGRDDKRDFLKRLREKGAFLLDAVYEPINQIMDEKIRQAKIGIGYFQLKKSIETLPLITRASILLIHGNVIKAIGKRVRDDFGSLEYEVHDIGFPRYYNDERFVKRIRISFKD
jgi:hypothetical protein